MKKEFWYNASKKWHYFTYVIDFLKNVFEFFEKYDIIIEIRVDILLNGGTKWQILRALNV